MCAMLRAICPRPALDEYERQRSMSLVPLLEDAIAERRCSKHTHMEDSGRKKPLGLILSGLFYIYFMNSFLTASTNIR